MKKLTFLVLLVLSCVACNGSCNAMGADSAMVTDPADTVTIMPVCEAKGPVYISILDHAANGYIGLDEIFLNYDNMTMSFFGKFKDMYVFLSLLEEGTLSGSIGDIRVLWSIDRTKSVIYGIVKCPPVVSAY